ncbi:hypothetical protein [Sphingomonas colocasiae]|uniref:hypothetical protein n=1 Tax=Sphingomonas colocasiae TaxID=1848973 RepID=UPI001CA61725|nr:hypothetical protein [Sphingomonas colocasiae]
MHTPAGDASVSATRISLAEARISASGATVMKVMTAAASMAATALGNRLELGVYMVFLLVMPPIAALLPMSLQGACQMPKTGIFRAIG